MNLSLYKVFVPFFTQNILNSNSCTKISVIQKNFIVMAFNHTCIEVYINSCSNVCFFFNKLLAKKLYNDAPILKLWPIPIIANNNSPIQPITIRPELK